MRMPDNRRGLPPSISRDTLRAWHFTGSIVSASAAGGGHVLSQQGAIPLPSQHDGRIGKSARFTGTQFVKTTATDGDVTAAQGEWTFQVWVKLTATPSGQAVIAGLSGQAIDDGTEDNNEQLLLLTDADRKLIVTWERTTGGTNVTCTSSAFVFTLNRWHLVAIRKRSQGGGLFTVDMVINGHNVETFTGKANATNGDNASQKWIIGGALDGADALMLPISADIGAVHFEAAVTDLSVLEDDWRRGASFALPTALHHRVLLEDPSAALIDITDPSALGGDFLNSWRTRDDLDVPTESIDVKILREDSDLSLAPLRTDSKINLTDVMDMTSFSPFLLPFRRVQGQFARTPLWLEPVASDWQTRFDGRYEEIDDAQSDVVGLLGRDAGGILMDTYMEEPRQYPKTFGGGACGPTAQQREVVMQEVIDDNGSLATVYTPETPLSCMLPLDPPNLARGFLLPALRGLAGGIGWDVKFSRWDPATSAFRLTFYDPGRDRVAPDGVIKDADILDVRGGRMSLAEVRNRVKSQFPDSSNLDGEGNRLPGEAMSEDVPSQTLYGLRAMETVEDQLSQIDTLTEAQRYTDSALADLRDPQRNSQMELRCMPELEVYDYLRFAADGIHYTAGQLGAVRTCEHAFASSSTTTISAQGKPAAGFKRWLKMEAGRNGKPPIKDATQALSERSFGTLMPAVLAIIDRTTHLAGQKFLALKNGDFARFTRGLLAPPDAWEMGAGVWSTGIEAESGTQLSGGFAIKFSNTTAKLRSQPLPIDGDAKRPYSFEVKWQRASGTRDFALTLEWLDVNRAVLSTAVLNPGGAVNGFVNVDNFPSQGAGTGVWYTSRCDGVVPDAGTSSDARFLRVSISGHGGSGADAVLVDSVAAFYTARRVKAALIDAGANVAWAGWGAFGGAAAGVAVNVPFSDGVQRISGIVDPFDVYKNIPLQVTPTTKGAYFECLESGTYRITPKVWIDPTIGGSTLVGGDAIGIEIVKNGTYNAVTGVRTGGVVIESARFPISILQPFASRISIDALLTKGDTVTVDIRNDSAHGPLGIANQDVTNAGNDDYSSFYAVQMLID